MVRLDEIHSLTEFQRDAKSHISRLKKTGRPAILTLNGKAAVVVQDSEAYQAMLDRIERAEIVEKVQRALESVDRGEGEPAANVFARLRKKHKIER